MILSHQFVRGAVLMWSDFNECPINRKLPNEVATLYTIGRLDFFKALAIDLHPTV